MRRCASFTSTNGGLGAESFKQAVVTQVGARLAASADKSNGGASVTLPPYVARFGFPASECDEKVVMCRGVRRRDGEEDGSGVAGPCRALPLQLPFAIAFQKQTISFICKVTQLTRLRHFCVAFFNPHSHDIASRLVELTLDNLGPQHPWRHVLLFAATEEKLTTHR
jgi:hypothetical protein